MNKKAYKALQADAHPEIRFELTDAGVVPGTGAAFRIDVTGQLTLAGKTRTVETVAEGLRTSDGALRLTGSLPVKMTDYGVDPPTAMLGALKTGDDVTVHFDLVAAPASGS